MKRNGLLNADLEDWQIGRPCIVTSLIEGKVEEVQICLVSSWWLALYHAAKQYRWIKLFSFSRSRPLRMVEDVEYRKT